jgi:hypothetical protein
MRNVSTFLILIAALITGCVSDYKVIATDDFEGDSLSGIWNKDKFLPGALTFQEDVVRSGNKSAMIVVRSGDQIDEEIGSQFERAELKEIKALYSDENSDYEYSFSLFIPDDFPTVPTRLVIAQWKQNCSSDNCDPDNPVLALRYVSGELFLTLQTGHERDILFSQKANTRNKWFDFRFQIRFTRTGSGYVKTWINDEQVVYFRGTTAYPEANGYPNPGKFYFKTGLYRDLMDQSMTIFLDDYTKKIFSR